MRREGGGALRASQKEGKGAGRPRPWSSRDEPSQGGARSEELRSSLFLQNHILNGPNRFEDISISVKLKNAWKVLLSFVVREILLIL